MPAKGVTTFDWPSLCTKYREERRSNPKLTLKAWCDSNKLNYSNASKQFAEIARLETAEMGSILAPSAMEKLGNLLQSKDEAISSKVATAILDRTGFSPKEQIVNVQNNISMGIALFASEDREKIKTMFEGAIIDDTGNPDS